MNLTGIRFSKDYRWGTTVFHKVVYFFVNTTASNWNNKNLAAEMRAYLQSN